MSDSRPIAPREPPSLKAASRAGGRTADRKLVALRARASQIAPLIAALGEDRLRAWWSAESFVAAESMTAHDFGTWQVAA